MRKSALLFLLTSLLITPIVRAGIFSQIRGIVHDPQHRPVAGAQITLHASHSALAQSTQSDQSGAFAFSALPLGDYIVDVAQSGFQPLHQTLTLASGTSPVLHFELQLSTLQQSVSVTTQSDTANVNSVTPTSLISRSDIERTPGADRTNSLAMITNFVPGAYITHDMLHMRGGHQISWLIDGVQIPNTNIASNLGAQIDPKDIDYIEVQRGSYSADTGDRTFGVFNVVPRTGFERNREAELVLTAGTYLQTNDQLNLGDHTQNFAWYASLNGNRSDYGLAPPIPQVQHDATNGYGGFSSFLYNRTPKDQLRLVTQLRQDFFQIPYDPDLESFGNQLYNSSGLRDGQHETDAIAAFSWLHTFHSSTVLQLSPFYHYNHADYQPAPDDTPVATSSRRASHYVGLQASVTGQLSRNTLQAGIYSFGQHDTYLFGSVFSNGSSPSFSLPAAASGGLFEAYVSDSFKPTAWLTLIGGLRQSHFTGAFSEDATSPRIGLALQLPKLHWVFRGFYGRFYQPPPLLTAAGPLVQYAQANNTDFQPLHGERDEEHQFGLQIPYRGWLLDADTFKTRIHNFLDHSNVGESSLYFPVTVDAALVRAWELTLRSPRLPHLGQAHLAYSNLIAEQRGAITGGLVCFPLTSPQCDAAPGYRPVDHDQRNTLNLGFDASLPWHAYASTNVYYGSGFTNGNPDLTAPYPGNYLPPHTTADLTLGKTFADRTTFSVTAINLTNHRVLLDNSLTFGGFHWNDPRELFAELRYRFHF